MNLLLELTNTREGRAAIEHLRWLTTSRADSTPLDEQSRAMRRIQLLHRIRALRSPTGGIH
jgi:hypothetical protein